MEGRERERGSPEHPEALGLALFYQLTISLYRRIYINSPLSFLHIKTFVIYEVDFSLQAMRGLIF